MILVSPTALRYVPVLLLHAVSLGYLLIKGPKSRQAWLFCGWLGGMTVMTATQLAARIVYAPRISGYLGWWGGVTGVTLAMIALLQFAYHFPRLRYRREALTALIISVLMTGALFIWMAWETVAAWPHHIYATVPADVEAALASRKSWVSYSFEGFNAGFLNVRDAGAWVSFKFFDIWQIVGNLWILTVWLRKTAQFTENVNERPFWRQAWRALRRPVGEEARLSRAWVLMMLLSPLPVVASSLDGTDLVPPGTFAIVHLLVLFVIMLTYVNHAPEPTSFMVKLVGISLVTLLIILGLISNYTMRAYREAYTQTRRTELQHIQTLIETRRLDALPPDVLYVAARSAEGLFAEPYQMVTGRRGAPDAATLAAQDAFRRRGLIRGHFPTQHLLLHEHPWLGIVGVLALEKANDPIDALTVPEGAISYRGANAYPKNHVLRYTFGHQDRRYEVGYSYPAYRAYLHQKSLPLLTLFVGTTVAILVIFPHFFWTGLVAPLTRLLQGVDRVDRGALDVNVPVTIEDEIGRLTHAFNRMVGSLQASEERLRALNLTLEQRVTDRTRDLATLYEVAALVNQTQELETLLTTALESILLSVQGNAGVILLRQGEEAETLSLAAQHGLPSDMVPSVVDLPVWEMTSELGEALLVHDLALDPRVISSFPPDFPYATFVSVPMYGKKKALGTLGIFGEAPRLFNVEDLGLLDAVAEQLGIAIDDARLHERAEAAIVLEERQRLARDLHDSVTQLLYSQTLFAAAATKALRTRQRERAESCLTQLGEAAGQALREMRLLIYRLRPPVLARVGLVGALRRRL